MSKQIDFVIFANPTFSLVHDNQPGYRSLNYGLKGKQSKLSTVSTADAQESMIYEFIKD